MSQRSHHTWNLSPVVVGLIGLVAGGIVVTTLRCIFLFFRKQTQRQTDLNNQQELTTTRPSSTIVTGGSSSATVAGVPILNYSKNYNGQKEITCAICLSDFIEGEQIRALPECFHFFHVPCIDAWLDSRSKCPICRANFTPPPRALIAVTLPDSSAPPVVQQRP